MRIITFVLVLFCSLISLDLYAQIEVDGIKYELNFEHQEAEVLYNNYRGDIVIPESFSVANVDFKVTSIGEGAFAGVWSAGGYVSAKSVIIPNTVIKIGDRAFKDYQGKVINIPNSVEILGEQLFYFSNIVEVHISNNVTKIPDESFVACERLKTVTLPTKLKEIGKKAFGRCESLKNIDLPSTLKTIDDEAFSGSGLTSIVIPKNVDKIGILGIGSRKLQSIDVENGNIKYTSQGNCLIDIESDSLIYGIDNSIIPNSVKIIGYKAFYNCEFNTIEIPNSVEIIGKSAFEDCKNLILIGLPEKVKSIESCAFMNCNNLLNITLSENLKEIGDSAFYKCKRLTSIKLPDSVNDIGEFCFRDCLKLSSIKCGNNIKNIKKGTFQNTEIKSFEIPLGVDTIYGSAFSSCELESIKIPNSVKVIGSNAFDYNIKLTSVDIPASVDSIGESAFNSCGITKLNFSNESDGLIISSNAFGKLQCTELTLPNNVVLYPGSFYECNLLLKLNLIGSVHFKNGNPFSLNDDKIKKFDLNLFDINKYCQSSFYVPFESSRSYVLGYNINDFYVNGVKTNDLYIKDAQYIGEYVFTDFDFLESINIVNCYDIRTNAFNDCDNVRSIVIDGFDKIDTNAFYCCSSIESIYFDNCKATNEWNVGRAFTCGSSLKSLVVGDNCSSFDNSIINIKGGSSYSNLNEIHLGVNVGKIYAKYGCAISSCDKVNVYLANPDIDIEELFTYLVKLCGYTYYRNVESLIYYYNLPNDKPYNVQHTFYFSSEMWKKLRAESLKGDVSKMGNISDYTLGCINEGIFRPYDATGIEKIEETVDENADNYPVYNLHGVKMQNTDNLPSGIYIKNGKKYMVR